MTRFLSIALLARFSAASLAQDEARFVGTWVGAWGRGLAHKLVVEKVDGRNAIFLYRTGDNAKSEDLSRARRNKGVIVNGVLHGKLASGAQVTYTLSADGRSLTGHYVKDDRMSKAVLEKRQP